MCTLTVPLYTAVTADLLPAWLDEEESESELIDLLDVIGDQSLSGTNEMQIISVQCKCSTTDVDYLFWCF